MQMRGVRFRRGGFIGGAGGVAPGRPRERAGCGETGVFTCKGEFVFTKSDGAAICRKYTAGSLSAWSYLRESIIRRGVLRVLTFP